MGDRTLLSMLRCIRVMATETAETARLSLLTFQLGTKESEVALPLVFLFLGACLRGQHIHQGVLSTKQGDLAPPILWSKSLPLAEPRYDCSHLCRQQDALEIPVPTQYHL